MPLVDGGVRRVAVGRGVAANLGHGGREIGEECIDVGSVVHAHGCVQGIGVVLTVEVPPVSFLELASDS